MGTWGTGILDNDTSCEVRESFYEKYNASMESYKIYPALIEEYESDLSDKECVSNVWLSLALCFWEIGSLDETLLSKINEIIDSGSDLALWEQLGGKESISPRKKALEKLQLKLSLPNPKPKKRKKPSVQVDGAFRVGDCLAFQYQNGLYGGIIVAECECYKNKGCHKLIFTDIEQEGMPVMDDFLNSHLSAFEWSMNLTNQQGWRFASINGCAGIIDSHNIYYNSKLSKDRLFEYLKSFFVVMGTIPIYTQVFYNTTGIDVENILEYEEFENRMQQSLTFWRKHEKESTYKRVSEETVRKLNILLHKHS